MNKDKKEPVVTELDMADLAKAAGGAKGGGHVKSHRKSTGDTHQHGEEQRQKSKSRAENKKLSKSEQKKLVKLSNRAGGR